MYLNGEGIPQDSAKAMDWLRKAADQGDPQAQYNLGEIYEHGQGVPQDFSQALEWLQKAAEHGAIPAQERLGAIYIRGEGAQQDFSKAADWYRKAAELGSTNAQLALGVMYHVGQGYRWTMSRQRSGSTRLRSTGALKLSIILGNVQQGARSAAGPRKGGRVVSQSCGTRIFQRSACPRRDVPLRKRSNAGFCRGLLPIGSGQLLYSRRKEQDYHFSGPGQCRAGLNSDQLEKQRGRVGNWLASHRCQ